MRRRDFITLLGGAAAAWPLAARGQQPARPVIGFLNGATADGYATLVAAFRSGLKDAGFVEGQNVVIEYRWANEDYDRLPVLAADLVQRRVAVIAATGAAITAVTAKAATRTIPIVFAIGADPLPIRLVDSLAHPDGNITGATLLDGELMPKRLGLLHELLPTATTIGLLENPTNPTHDKIRSNVEASAPALGLQTLIVQAANERDFDTAFASLVERKVDALAVFPDSVFTAQRERLAVLAARYAIPAMFPASEFSASGGLVSYGADRSAAYQQAGTYVGRILKGAKPSDLPVLQPTKFELTVNLKTAKALGLTISREFQLLADEVIE